MRLGLWVLAAFFVFAAPAIAAPDELARLNMQIVNDPTNIELNLRYARLAEESGQPRKALAAYERVLVYDPNNVEAQKGLERIRVGILPTVTEIFTEFGGGWDTNPHEVPSGRMSDFDLFGRIAFRDERTLGDTRWRTSGLLSGDLFRQSGDLNYGYGSLAVGPVYSVGGGFTLHPSIGGATSYFDHHLFYNEGFASALIEGNQGGVAETFRLRGGYRDFDSFFPATQGFFADFTAKFAKPEVFTTGDLLVFSPWARWSGVGGTFLTNTPTVNVSDSVQLGRYEEVGARMEYYLTLADWLIAGPNFSYTERGYAAAPLSTGGFLKRRDGIASPGASIIFRNLPNVTGDIRLDYNYERDDSNDPEGSYTQHTVTLTYARRW
jgi:hypothetical protein